MTLAAPVITREDILDALLKARTARHRAAATLLRTDTPETRRVWTAARSGWSGLVDATRATPDDLADVERRFTHEHPCARLTACSFTQETRRGR